MSTLILNTQLNVENIPIDYTDVSAEGVPAGNVITAVVKVPKYLLYSEIGGDSALALFNIELKNPFNATNSALSDIENNIQSIVFNKTMLLTFAKRLDTCLKGQVDCTDYEQLKYIKSNESGRKVIAGLGEATVRILQHLLVKFIFGYTDVNVINTAMDNMIANNSSTATNILLANEHEIRLFIQNRDATHDTTESAYSTYLSDPDAFTSIQSAEIVNRIMASILGTEGATTALSSKVKNALSNFMYQDLKGKLHDRTQVIGTKTVYPIKFVVGDNIHFTIVMNSAKLSLGDITSTNVVAGKLPNQTNLDSLSSMGATKIYFKLEIGEVEYTTSSTTANILITNATWSAFNSLSTTQKSIISDAIKLDISKKLNIDISLITIEEITEGSLNVKIKISEFTENTKPAATVKQELENALTAGDFTFTELKAVLVEMPEVAAAIFTGGIENISASNPPPSNGEPGSLKGTASIASTSSDVNPKIVTDKNGNIYLYGSSAAGAFDVISTNISKPDITPIPTNISNASYHVLSKTYLIKYGMSGIIDWKILITSSSTCIIADVKVDSTDTYLYIDIWSSAGFNMFKSSNTLIMSNSLNGTFLVKLRISDCTISWTVPVGYLYPNIATTEVFTTIMENTGNILLDSSGNVYLLGFYNASHDYGLSAFIGISTVNPIQSTTLPSTTASWSALGTTIISPLKETQTQPTGLNYYYSDNVGYTVLIVKYDGNTGNMLWFNKMCNDNKLVGIGMAMNISSISNDLILYTHHGGMVYGSDAAFYTYEKMYNRIYNNPNNVTPQGSPVYIKTINSSPFRSTVNQGSITSYNPATGNVTFTMGMSGMAAQTVIADSNNLYMLIQKYSSAYYDIDGNTTALTDINDTSIVVYNKNTKTVGRTISITNSEPVSGMHMLLDSSKNIIFYSSLMSSYTALKSNNVSLGLPYYDAASPSYRGNINIIKFHATENSIVWQTMAGIKNANETRQPTIILDNSGNLYVYSLMKPLNGNSTMFDVYSAGNSITPAISFPITRDKNVVIIKYGADGAFKWASHIGHSPFSDFDWDRRFYTKRLINHIALNTNSDNSNTDICVVGMHYGTSITNTVDVYDAQNNSTAVKQIQYVGSFDIFLARYAA